MAGPLLVGYDGTPGAQAAAGEALALASELGAEVIFAFAYWTNTQGGEVADMLSALGALGQGHLRDAQALAEAAGVSSRGELVKRCRASASSISPTPTTPA